MAGEITFGREMPTGSLIKWIAMCGREYCDGRNAEADNVVRFILKEILQTDCMEWDCIVCKEERSTLRKPHS